MLQRLRLILERDSLRQVGAYTITGSLTKAVSFAALPFFVNTLSEGDIGILNLFSNCIVFLTPIISMGVLYTISIDYFTLSKEKYATVFSTGLILPTILSLLLVPLLYSFQDVLERTFHFQPAFSWLIPLCLYLNFCFEAFIILIRNQNKLKLFTLVSLLKIFIEITLAILFILTLCKSWYSRALGLSFSLVVTGGMFFYHVVRKRFLIATFDFKILKNELVFGLSGMLLQTAIFFINTSDKFFVISHFGKEQAGYYAVASTCASMQYVVGVSLLQYMQPVLYKKFSQSLKWKDAKSLYYKYFFTMFVTLTGVVLFTYFVYQFVLKAAYKEYLHYFYILSISAFVWTISNVFLQYIVFNKNKKLIIQLSAMCIFIAVTVNYITAKYAGVVSLGLGQIFISIIVLGLILNYNRKLKYFG